jgi:hypothetical protein
VALRELLDIARDQVAEVTGRPVESISGFHRDGDGAWIVTVDVLELERVPSTLDLMASYAVTLSDDGELLGMERVRRYHRSAVDDGNRG